jgi:hypothetical protein
LFYLWTYWNFITALHSAFVLAWSFIDLVCLLSPCHLVLVLLCNWSLGSSVSKQIKNLTELLLMLLYWARNIYSVNQQMSYWKHRRVPVLKVLRCIPYWANTFKYYILFCAILWWQPWRSVYVSVGSPFYSAWKGRWLPFNIIPFSAPFCDDSPEGACRMPVLFCLGRPVAVIKWRPAPHCHRYSWVHSVWMENPDIRLIAWGELIGTSHGCWFLMKSALGPLFGPLRPVALVTLHKVKECLHGLRIRSPFVALVHLSTT